MIAVYKHGSGEYYHHYHHHRHNNNTNICNAHSVSKHTESEVQAMSGFHHWSGPLDSNLSSVNFLTTQSRGDGWHHWSLSWHSTMPCCYAAVAPLLKAVRVTKCHICWGLHSWHWTKRFVLCNVEVDKWKRWPTDWHHGAFSWMCSRPSSCEKCKW